MDEKLSNQQKGLLAMAAGAILLLQALDVFNIFRVSLNTVVVLVAVGMIFYGVSKLQLVQKIKHLFSGSKKSHPHK